MFCQAAFGSLNDLEHEHDGREPDVDDEPSLGSTEPIEPELGAPFAEFGSLSEYRGQECDGVYDQTNWFGFGSDRDLEYDDSEDGCE